MKRKDRKSLKKRNASKETEGRGQEAGLKAGAAGERQGDGQRPDAETLIAQLSGYSESFESHTGLSLDGKLSRALALYVTELFKWNDRAALLSRGDEARVVERHIMDSLSLLAFLHETKGTSLLDIGSGAGFPGIPLKLASPGMTVSLVESTHKKQLFLNYVIQRLGLAETLVLGARAENAPWKASAPEGFDVVTCRATLGLSDLAELGGPAVKYGGLLVAYKGGRYEEELQGAKEALTGARLRLMDIWDSPWGPGRLLAFQRAR
jgi:16S rRNA (guanine527-N7)-methyltransferase